MKFSKNWLQEYINIDFSNEALSSFLSNQKIVDVLNQKAFEVEEIIPLSNDNDTDTVFDIKVLPNRAHDALGHKGMAHEIVTCLGYGPQYRKNIPYKITSDQNISSPRVTIEDSTVCTRFMSVRIDGIKVEASPDKYRKRLEAIGQRSINNIVDITNYVQFSLNKPMHAYDARSIKGTLTARFAKGGETLVTLDDKTLSLDESTLVIADDERALGLAGIKGGKYSGIQEDTTSIILESANFEPILTRKTSVKYGIKTDASKRFENGISNSLVEEGLYMTAQLICELYPEARVSLVTDVYPSKDIQKQVTFTLEDINNILGSSYTDELVTDTLKKLSFTIAQQNDSKYTVVVPEVRLDISIKEDIAEELGRIMGYNFLNTEDRLPPRTRDGLPHKRMYYEQKIKDIFFKYGFSEVMTYTFGNSGEVELKKGLADDKEKLRSTLKNGIETSLKLNLYNAPLLGELGQSEIRIFEFGNVFTKSNEVRHFAFAINDGGKKSNFSKEADDILSEIEAELGIEKLVCVSRTEKPFFAEIDFDVLIETLPEPIETLSVGNYNDNNAPYEPVSSYPFVARDIALWAPQTASAEEIESLIRANAGELLKRSALFDEFEKEGRTSYAFRLIFQSFERTLTDNEVNENMDRLYNALKAQGFEIR